MKKWIQKAIVQKTISYLPYSNKLNYIFQKYVTKGVYLDDEYFYDRLLHAKEHISYYKKYSNKTIPSTCLEIGTGWYPIVPISLFLSGADKILSVDISFLTSKERILATINRIDKCHKEGELSSHINILEDRYSIIENILANQKEYSLEQILEKLKITYLIEDARKLSLADNTIDLINSNNTFEHMYPEILVPILKEFTRIVKKTDGVMSHFIDMSDHFAHFDKSINIYNFLRFSDKRWKTIDNTIQPQNRLRMYEYEDIFKDLKIPISDKTFRKGNVEDLKKIKLDKQYEEREIMDVAISHCHFVSDMKQF